MSDFDQNYHQLLQILRKQRLKKLALHLSKQLFFILGVIFISFLVASLADIPFRFDPQIRLGIVLGVIFITSVLFIRQIIWPSLQFIFAKGEYSYEKIAQEIGFQFEEIRDDLLNVLQIYRLTKYNPEKYSIDLVNYSLSSILNTLKKLRFNKLYPITALKRAGAFLLTPIFLIGLMFGIVPLQIQQGLKHIIHPTTRFKPTPIENMIISPGDVTKVEGDSCQIAVQIEGSYKGPVSLTIQEATSDIQNILILKPDSNQIYHHLIKDLRVPLHYFAKARNQRSNVYNIQVEKRPFIRKLEVRLDYPNYTELPFRYQEENVGDVTALFGTRVRLHAYSNKALDKAHLIFGNGKSKTIQISGDELKTDFTIRRDDSYHFHLEDKFGHTNENPIEYGVHALKDQYPVVEITSPGEDIDLSEQMKLPLRIEAEDDFGFSNLRLGYRIESGVTVTDTSDTSYQYIDLSIEGKRGANLSVDYLWDMVDLNLMPEDLVYYFAEIWDNDQVSGPKRSISRVYTARFPSVYEIYDEVAQGEDKNVEKLEEVLRESKELKERVDRIHREINQQQQMDWLKKQDLEEIAQKHKELKKSVEEIQKDLQQMVERMESNQMLSMETVKKFQEMQELFDDIMTPQLKKALEELKKAAENLDERKLQQAINKLQISQEDLLKRLERTINLFKRLQLEQRIDQATKLVENLSERQKMLNKQIENAKPEDISDMLHQQQKAAEDARSLDDILKNLDQELKDAAQFDSPMMDSLLTQIQKAMQNMRQSQENMKQGNMQQASRSGKLTEQNLKNMLRQLQQMKESFLQSQKQEFMAEFSRASEDLLQLSQAQEGLMEKTNELSSASPQMEEVAERQQEQLNRLGNITDQLYQLSQKTFFVSPEIGQAIGKSISNMQKALQHLEERKNNLASRRQSAAMGGLNETVMQVQKAMQGLQQASSAVGLEEFLKRLEKMSGKQQGINQKTFQLGKDGKMTLQQQAAMARLAAEQNALRKSLEQLQKEFGNRSDVLGRLDGISKEMEKVVKDMEQKKVDPRTIDRQKRILSRLLDAQRSLHRRDYSKKRRSTPGKTYFVRSPSQIDEKVKKQKERFLEDLIQARKVGFNPDYLDLIRSYFQALTEKGKVRTP